MGRAEALAMRPVRNPEIVEEPHGDTLRIAYKISMKPWFARIADRFGMWDGKPMQKRLELDEMGLHVWQLIDGKNTVREIAAIFAKDYGVGRREAELSVSSFLKSLGERGIIALAES